MTVIVQSYGMINDPSFSPSTAIEMNGPLQRLCHRRLYRHHPAVLIA